LLNNSTALPQANAQPPATGNPLGVILSMEIFLRMISGPKDLHLVQMQILRRFPFPLRGGSPEGRPQTPNSSE
jgi:hypothetical protein